MRAIEAGEKSQTLIDHAIVHPADLTAKLSSQVCGQCHGAWVMKEGAGKDWSMTGHSYRPGDDLHLTRKYIDGKTDHHLLGEIHAESSFWPDGEIRVAGREYNGLLKSPCFTHDLGDERRMSCISCHDMHASTTATDKKWANDQLGKGMDGNNACYQCHASYRENPTKHTHHPADSPGSSCYNCHMPHTSYGLMKAVRGHTITSPSVTDSLATGKPNACNQCHLDQTLQWSAGHLNTFYGQAVPEMDETQRGVAASLLWMTRGDAAQRALTAWNLGWKPAQETAGTNWMPFFLTDLMFDDYDAIRYIAHRSLRTIPGLNDIAFDHMKPAQQQDRVMQNVMTRWLGVVGTERPNEDRLLYDESGNIQWQRFQQLRKQRDQRKVVITE